MTILWLSTILITGVGALLLLNAAPQLADRRRIRRQLEALSRHPGTATEAADEADLLRPVPVVRRWATLLRRFPRLASEKQLRNSGLDWSVERLLTLRVAVGGILAVFAFVAVENAILALIAFAIGLTLPGVYVGRRKNKRLASFEQQLPDAIELISRALRAGHPLVHGLKMAGDDAPEPLATEFRIAYEEHRFGMPLDETLVRLGERIELPDARMLITAILVQRDAGGNIAEVFEKLAQLMRERVILNRQVRIHTAQGRMSGYVLSSLPVVVAGLLLIINPSYIRLLVDDPIGRVMLGAAVGMQVIGHVWIQKIVKVEV